METWWRKLWETLRTKSVPLLSCGSQGLNLGCQMLKTGKFPGWAFLGWILFRILGIEQQLSSFESFSFLINVYFGLWSQIQSTIVGNTWQQTGNTEAGTRGWLMTFPPYSGGREWWMCVLSPFCSVQDLGPGMEPHSSGLGLPNTIISVKMVFRAMERLVF